MIYSKSKRETSKSSEQHDLGSLLLKLSKSNTILTESKPEVQNKLICSKSREDTGKSSGPTTFSKTSVDSQ